MCTSRGTGRTEGRKLNRPICKKTFFSSLILNYFINHCFAFLQHKYVFWNIFHTWLIFSQSARSLAFANAVDKPTTLTGFSVWDEMKFVRDTMTSSTGPLSSPSKCKVHWKTERKKKCKHSSSNLAMILVKNNKKENYVHLADGFHLWWEWKLSEHSFCSASFCWHHPTSLG